MKIALLIFFGNLSRWIRDVLSDDGNQSTMRLVMLLAWGCVLTVWTVLSFVKGDLLPVPASVLELIAAATLGKCWQNHVEATAVAVRK